MGLWKFGHDMGKWLIYRGPTGSWAVCPPMTDDPHWYTRGGVFETGAEALAAFAGGEK